MGASAGGHRALRTVISRLPADYPLPLLVVQHLHSGDEGGFARGLEHVSALSVVTPCDKQSIEAGRIYVAPANYHMLIEWDRSIALSTDPRVKWSRPSIDVLFDSAARVYRESLAAVILTGANDDGAEGMQAIRDVGGMTIAQDPGTAESPRMPQAAIDAAAIDSVLSLEGIAELLLGLGMGSTAKGRGTE